MVYGLFRALPGDRAFLSPSSALRLADLTPASGRQDHTTSPSAVAPFVKGAPRVHRIPSRVDDVAQRPSVGQDGGSRRTDLPDGLREIFLQEGLDFGKSAVEVIYPSGKSVGFFRHCEER